MSAALTPLPASERTRSARLIRDALALLSSKWSVDMLLALGAGSRRYHELLADLEPISEKVLTLAAPMRALGTWSLARGRQVDAARERFDLRRAMREEQRRAA
jgi:HxlR-like helix-turn-helix